MVSGASYTGLVAGILFLLWKRGQRDWERTNVRLDDAINKLNNSIRDLNDSLIDLKMELTRHSASEEGYRQTIKKIEQRVFS